MGPKSLVGSLLEVLGWRGWSLTVSCLLVPDLSIPHEFQE